MFKMHMLYENFKANFKSSEFNSTKNTSLLPFMSLLHKFMFEKPPKPNVLDELYDILQ